MISQVPSPTTVVVAGTDSGAYGASFWSAYLAEAYKNVVPAAPRMVVLIDSAVEPIGLGSRTLQQPISPILLTWPRFRSSFPNSVDEFAQQAAAQASAALAAGGVSTVQDYASILDARLSAWFLQATSNWGLQNSAAR